MRSNECTRVTPEIQRAFVKALVDAATQVRERGLSMPIELRAGMVGWLELHARQAERIDYSMRWSELAGVLCGYSNVAMVWHPELATLLSDLNATAYGFALATETP